MPGYIVWKLLNYKNVIFLFLKIFLGISKFYIDKKCILLSEDVKFFFQGSNNFFY
jgi:hypothetical protein